MKKIVLLSGLFISSLSFSQTKTIAFKRHNGVKTNFSSFLKLEGIIGGTSNLGMAPEKWVRNSELRKVILINDTLAAMVTEETCYNEYSYQHQETEKWRAGTDTVTRHPLFSSELTVDSMRKILHTDYYFANDMKDVEFVGFGERDPKSPKETRQEKVKEEIIDLGLKNDKKSKFGKYTLLSIIIASSLGIGLIKLR
ncbi:hypothetical protein N9F27_03450 [Crocinitomicaceae bacterium]|jgi:hypothetical protein|nr:hypothetical protein [Crocinitomicaceae bacterium]